MWTAPYYRAIIGIELDHYYAAVRRIGLDWWIIFMARSDKTVEGGRLLGLLSARGAFCHCQHLRKSQSGDYASSSLSSPFRDHIIIIIFFLACQKIRGVGQNLFNGLSTNAIVPSCIKGQVKSDHHSSSSAAFFSTVLPPFHHNENDEDISWAAEWKR